MFSALLDTCVLVPSRARDVLLEIASTGAYPPVVEHGDPRLVTGWEPLVTATDLPDPDDRHVVAAAWAGRADVIVTDNLADFPSDALPTPLFRQSLDAFLLDTLDLYPAQVVAAIRAVARRTGRSSREASLRARPRWLRRDDLVQLARLGAGQPGRRHPDFPGRGVHWPRCSRNRRLPMG